MLCRKCLSLVIDIKDSSYSKGMQKPDRLPRDHTGHMAISGFGLTSDSMQQRLQHLRHLMGCDLTDGRTQDIV